MVTPFGKPMRQHFLFHHNWTNMNHGSFGGIPDAIRDSLHEKQNLVESAPDLFIRYQYGSQLYKSRLAIADYVSAPVETVVLLPNATSGIDTVLRNLIWEPSDHLLIFQTVYGTCERAALHLQETTGLQITQIPLVYPVSDSQILALFQDAVTRIRRSGGNVKMAVFDVISFQPAVRMPFEALTATCQQLGILSCVDGAHCLGQLEIRLGELQPDFFVGNLHKWLFVPRGCAILYVPVRNQYLLRTSFPTSWGFRPRNTICQTQFNQAQTCLTPFEDLFQSFGTMDYSPFLCIPEALEFRKTVAGGEERILEYNAALAARGGQLVARTLGTQVLDNIQGTLTKGCSVVNVRLPIDLARLEDTSATVDWICQCLIKRYRTFVPIFGHGGYLWARISAQIYLDEDDFACLGRALRSLCTECSGEVPKSQGAL